MASKKKSKAAKGCGCVRMMNAALEESGLEVSWMTSLFTGVTRCLIATSRKDPKSRKKETPLAANYCPFCGVKYEVAPGPQVRVA